MLLRSVMEDSESDYVRQKTKSNNINRKNVQYLLENSREATPEMHVKQYDAQGELEPITKELKIEMLPKRAPIRKKTNNSKRLKKQEYRKKGHEEIKRLKEYYGEQ